MDTTKNNGQIGKITGSISGETQWNQGFSYDELGRLSSIAGHQGSTMSTLTYSQGYTFDRYGNRFQSANATLGLPAVSSSEIVAATNRFIATGSTPTTYDAAGNVTNDTKFRGLSFAYDANGRQTSASNGTWTETQTYDCAGQRVQTSVSSTTRTLVYDIFGQDVADYSGSTGGTLERENIYRGAQLLATYEAASTAIKYVLTDAQGSTRTVMNNSGSSSTIIARHDYLPFGEEIGSGIGLRSTSQGYAASDTNRQKYALLERDATTGLDHTWWRKYESLSGRLTTPDPYLGSMTTGDPQSFNRYSYVGNDPVNFIDPTGLFALIVPTCADGGPCPYYPFVDWGSSISDWPDAFWIIGPHPEPNPRPGGGGHPQKHVPTVDRRVLSDCVDMLFGVTMTSFQETERGRTGGFTGIGFDVINNGGKSATYSIYNDVTRYTGQALKAAAGNTHKGERVTGLTAPDYPWTNYTANDLKSSMEMLKTQVHELGHSLDVITGVRYGDKGIEAGFKLEGCVAKYGGFKYK